MLEYAVFWTSLGWMGVGRRTWSVARVILPRAHQFLVTEQLRRSLLPLDTALIDVGQDVFGTLPERLVRQMEGEPMTFDDDPDTSDWTPFRTRVWEATRAIPYGETRSYSWIANYIGQPNAPRAVGQALHNNPVPMIVPCHRVVGANGALVGFGSGCDLKARLLALEKNDRAASGHGE